MISKRTLANLLGCFLVSTMLVSCDKNDDDNNVNNNNNNGTNSGETAKVSMRLTDAPANYEAVYLDIRNIEVTMEGSNAVELTPVRPGVYEILQFRNGLDTLLAEADLPAGTINQIRLKLGDNNSVVVDGETHALTTPSGQQSGIKLNLHETLEAGGAYVIWIDFDAAKSIHRTGNGKYMLKPVIRAYSALTNGQIEGYVIPLAALTTVYAINGTDTFSAIPNINGYYMFNGLPEADYDVWFDAEAPGYKDEWIEDVEVSFGKETDLGTIVIDL